MTLFSPGGNSRDESFLRATFLSPIHLFLAPPSRRPSLPRHVLSLLGVFHVRTYVRTYASLRGERVRHAVVWPILRTVEHVHGRDVSTYLPTPKRIELPPRAPMWQLSYLTYRRELYRRIFLTRGVPQAGQASPLTTAEF